jgi:hypothetical protein
MSGEKRRFWREARERCDIFDGSPGFVSIVLLNLFQICPDNYYSLQKLLLTAQVSHQVKQV